MKIASSQVNMSNDYQSDWASARVVTDVRKPTTGEASNVELSQEAIAKIRRQAHNAKEQNPNVQPLLAGIDRAEIIAAAGSESMSIERSINTSTIDGSTSRDLSEIEVYDNSISVMKMLLERMSGKSIDLYDASNITQKAVDAKSNGQGNGVGFIPGQTPPPFGGANGVFGNGQGEERWVQVVQYNYEKQSNSVEFSGEITTENGDSVSFHMNVGFSQEYEQISAEVMRAEELKDPLIISFSTKPVALSDEKMAFDIDADGETDQIAQLQQGFGFLALDKNGDNQINDGSELFGALSGNGFADLAQYDDDQNGYIDENDQIFDQLSIWVKNENSDELVSLKEAGIGAIATDSVDSPMNIRNSQGDERLGVIQKSGYYLNEDGTPGLVQQMDFVV